MASGDNGNSIHRLRSFKRSIIPAKNQPDCKPPAPIPSGQQSTSSLAVQSSPGKSPGRTPLGPPAFPKEGRKPAVELPDAGVRDHRHDRLPRSTQENAQPPPDQWERSLSPNPTPAPRFRPCRLSPTAPLPRPEFIRSAQTAVFGVNRSHPHPHRRASCTPYSKTERLTHFSSGNHHRRTPPGHRFPRANPSERFFRFLNDRASRNIWRFAPSRVLHFSSCRTTASSTSKPSAAR